MKTLLQDGVTSQAEHRPEAVAICWADEAVTYGELEAWSNRLARLLQAHGCRRGDRVALILPKSPTAIAAMLGVLKADCAYIPVDPKNPIARVAKVLGALECRCVLGVAATRDLLFEALHRIQAPDASCGVRVGLLESGATVQGGPVRFGLDELAELSAEPVERRNGRDDLAHILFTSGSTGAPKGVMITHENVIRFVEWAVRHFGMVPEDRVSGHSPLHFDLSTFDIYGAFAAGARLYPIPPESNLLPHRLAELMREAELTQWFSVPSILTHMAKSDVVRPGDFPSMRRLLWCGERFSTPGLIYWMQRLPHIQFTNLYGPTETTIASSYYAVPRCPEDAREAIPIGGGCEGEELLVLGDDLRPVRAGEVGDLYIRGVGLSPGYWRDPERTATAFIQNPHGHDSADRIYKTGDLARVDEQGRVLLLGRADSQIKSRGYRIELGEIEAALSALDMVRESAVVACESDGFEGTVIGCGYVPASGAEVTPVLLRQRLAEALPPYMLPARWMHLERLPLNPNGKVDRPALKGLFSQ
jgi:amino acid adenylation domain-containing protein